MVAHDNTTAAPGSLEASSWPYIIYFSIAVVTTPLYLAIVVLLFRYRNTGKFSSTFYTLIMSQGIADIFYIFCYTIYFGLSYVGTIEGIGTFFRWTTANISFKSIYYCLSLRCIGVTFISFQRYIMICRWNSNFSKRISSTSRPVIFLIHWILSFILIIPILTIGSVRFGCVCKKLVAIDPFDLMLCSINAEAIVLTTFLLCIIFYGFTLHHIYVHFEGIKQRKSEVRLCVPVAALISAFFLIFLYHLIQLTWIAIYHEQQRAVRVLEPLFSGFLSFFTPWVLLFSSREIMGLFYGRSSKIRVMRKSQMECSITHHRTNGHI